MPEMQMQDRKADGTIYYEPVVLKVRAYSQYRPDEEISFEGVQDFWGLPENLRGENKPPIGTIARFTLKTKPKVKKPSELYRDIVKVQKASEDEYTGPPAAPQASYVDKETSAAPVNGSGPDDGMYDPYGKPTRAYWDAQQVQIRTSMAFNNLTTMLASGIPDKAMTAEADDAVEDWGNKWAQWHEWYDEASRGLPLTPVQDEEEVKPSSEYECPHGEMWGHCEQCPKPEAKPADPFRDSPDDTFEATAQPEKPVEDVEDLPW